MRSPEPICDSLDIYAMLCLSQISKHGALSFFFNFFMKSCSHAHDWPTKRQFYQNYTLLWAKKVNRMPFFSDFSRKKITALMPIFCKNVHSLKTHSSHYVHSLKNTVLSRHFFQKFS